MVHNKVPGPDMLISFRFTLLDDVRTSISVTARHVFLLVVLLSVAILLLLMQLQCCIRSKVFTDTGHPLQVSFLGRFHVGHSLVLDKLFLS